MSFLFSKSNLQASCSFIKKINISILGAAHGSLAECPDANNSNMLGWKVQLLLRLGTIQFCVFTCVCALLSLYASVCGVGDLCAWTWVHAYAFLCVHIVCLICIKCNIRVSRCMCNGYEYMMACLSLSFLPFASMLLFFLWILHLSSITPSFQYSFPSTFIDYFLFHPVLAYYFSTANKMGKNDEVRLM